MSKIHKSNKKNIEDQPEVKKEHKLSWTYDLTEEDLNEVFGK